MEGDRQLQYVLRLTENPGATLVRPPWFLGAKQIQPVEDAANGLLARINWRLLKMNVSCEAGPIRHKPIYLLLPGCNMTTTTMVIYQINAP